MRHQKAGRKLGRNSAHRKAMFRNMVTSLMQHGRIQTTEAKAKELRRIADRVITLGKRVPPSELEGLTGDELDKAKAKRLHNIRRASSYLRDKEAVSRVFNEYAERFKDRPGGYTRVIKSGFRQGDNAPMAVVELVGELVPADESAGVEGEFFEAGDSAAEEPVAEEPVAEEPVAETEDSAEETTD